jgi:hypothetical protein
MNRCEKCGTTWFDWQSHSCRQYEVWRLEDGREEAVEIVASGADDAAERWAIRHNDEGDLTDADPVTLCIADHTGEIVYRTVSAELTIDYHVDELTDDQLEEATARRREIEAE